VRLVARNVCGRRRNDGRRREAHQLTIAFAGYLSRGWRDHGAVHPRNRPLEIADHFGRGGHNRILRQRWRRHGRLQSFGRGRARDRTDSQ
jgi:hypothetical protein